MNSSLCIKPYRNVQGGLAEPFHSSYGNNVTHINAGGDPSKFNWIAIPLELQISQVSCINFSRIIRTVLTPATTNGFSWWYSTSRRRLLPPFGIENKFKCSTFTEPRKSFGTWLREVSSCSCLTYLPGPAWVLLSKICKDFFSALYIQLLYILFLLYVKCN